MGLMDIRQYITTDAKICHGKPCFKGTRILVHTILELLAAGVRQEEILGEKYYPQLTPAHIRAALEYAAKLSEAGELVELPA